MPIWLTLFVVWLIGWTLLTFLTGTALILLLVIRELRKAQTRVVELAGWSIDQAKAANESQAQLLDKTVAILSAKGPLEFQAVQAMSQPGLYNEPEVYDPSDEAEIDRLRAFGIIPTDEEGDPDGPGSPADEREFLEHLGVPGYGT